ncbi:hypothetical protein [Rahnella perminowiae]|uniref:hypothetical protein n=1 Tax=Rahnella perminowiae TaxID=2816244 RepID=UPI00215CD3B2|nr:hypothetical protein [Rahnella perminowiae]MCR9003111.1 hypothetical protein [Rahnella perminowiae]
MRFLRWHPCRLIRRPVYRCCISARSFTQALYRRANPKKRRLSGGLSQRHRQAVDHISVTLIAFTLYSLSAAGVMQVGSVYATLLPLAG